jgi:hypothetical protein
MIVEIKIIFIGTTKITPKNRSELVFFGCVDRKRPVLGGPVRSPQYLGRSWTGCGPRLRVLGAKNRTEPDLKTLLTRNLRNSNRCFELLTLQDQDIKNDCVGPAPYYFPHFKVVLENRKGWQHAKGYDGPRTGE